MNITHDYEVNCTKFIIFQHVYLFTCTVNINIMLDFEDNWTEFHYFFNIQSCSKPWQA